MRECGGRGREGGLGTACSSRSASRTLERYASIVTPSRSASRGDHTRSSARLCFPFAAEGPFGTLAWYSGPTMLSCAGATARHGRARRGGWARLLRVDLAYVDRPAVGLLGRRLVLSLAQDSRAHSLEPRVDLRPRVEGCDVTVGNRAR